MPRSIHRVAKGYVEAVNYRIEQEKMAVVIQEVVGNQYGDVFYPHISGVAQSYNYYPFAHMKPEEGFAVIALGLGRYVVEGRRHFVLHPVSQPRDQFPERPVQRITGPFLCSRPEEKRCQPAGRRRCRVCENSILMMPKMHGTLKHLCLGLFCREQPDHRRAWDSRDRRVVNFADILKYNYIPLAKTIEVVLDVVKEALGSPVEIEFAVDLNKDEDYKASFYLLQIKPLIGNVTDFDDRYGQDQQG